MDRRTRKYLVAKWLEDVVWNIRDMKFFRQSYVNECISKEIESKLEVPFIDVQNLKDEHLHMPWNCAYCKKEIRVRIAYSTSRKKKIHWKELLCKSCNPTYSPVILKNLTAFYSELRTRLKKNLEI